MLQILQIVLPVFIIIGAGYLAASRKAFTAEQASALMRFAIQFAVPCLLFLAIARLDLKTVFKPEILMSFYIGAFLSFTITAIGARLIFRHKPGSCVSIGFAALFSNSLLIGIVIVELAYGVAALEPAFAVIAVHVPFCYVLGITAMEFSRVDGLGFFATLKRVFTQVFSNALTIGLMLGFIVNWSTVTLPGPLVTAIELIARAALPVALFGLGAVLVSYKISSGLGEMSMISVSKLLIHPMIVYCLGHYVFQLSDDLLKPIVIIATMPPGVNAYLFANMYGRATNIAASTVLFATAISIMTISAWLVFLG